MVNIILYAQILITFTATTCSPSPFHIKMMLKATDSQPLNYGFTGKGNSSSQNGLEDQIRAGAIGLKVFICFKYCFN